MRMRSGEAAPGLRCGAPWREGGAGTEGPSPPLRGKGAAPGAFPVPFLPTADGHHSLILPPAAGKSEIYPNP